MRARRIAIVLIALSFANPAGVARAQQTMGLFLNLPGAFTGYTLLEALRYHDTYLINNEGLLCHSWQGTANPGNMAYILESGDLVRAVEADFNPVFGRGSGAVNRLDWEGNLLWEFVYSDSLIRQHHDIQPLPNGNVLLLAWEAKTEADAIANGRDPALVDSEGVWPEHVIEVEPVGATGANIVWEWHVWDHLVQDFDSTKANFGVVGDHPELADVNFSASLNPDWLHANSVSYHADLDQIVISLRRFSEFWIIDHATTTEEAAGHTGGARGMGGDILYRWGNPQTYDRGTENDRKLFRQHDARWVPEGSPGAGNLTVFNNGNDRPEGEYSTVEEIVTTVDVNGDYPVPPPGVPHGPAAAVWTFTATPPESLWSHFISGAHRLPNGNTLICEGATGTLLEVDTSDQPVWVYVNPVNANGPQYQGDPPGNNFVFRTHRYAPDFAGFDGRDLTPGPPIELYIVDAVGDFLASSRFTLYPNYPNPFRPQTTLRFSLQSPELVVLDVYDVAGRHVARLLDEPLGEGEHRLPWDASGLASGVYLYSLRVGADRATGKMTMAR